MWQAVILIWSSKLLNILGTVGYCENQLGCKPSDFQCLTEPKSSCKQDEYVSRLKMSQGIALLCIKANSIKSFTQIYMDTLGKCMSKVPQSDSVVGMEF